MNYSEYVTAIRRRVARMDGHDLAQDEIARLIRANGPYIMKCHVAGVPYVHVAKTVLAKVEEE